VRDGPLFLEPVQQRPHRAVCNWPLPVQLLGNLPGRGPPLFPRITRIPCRPCFPVCSTIKTPRAGRADLPPGPGLGR
jgi:hypothetical protein